MELRATSNKSTIYRRYYRTTTQHIDKYHDLEKLAVAAKPETNDSCKGEIPPAVANVFVQPTQIDDSMMCICSSQHDIDFTFQKLQSQLEQSLEA